MFRFIHNHKRLIQIAFVLLIVPPFAFFGMESYTRSMGGRDDVATVDGVGISQREFAEELRQQQERLRAAFGRGFDAAALDTPESRAALLQSIVSQRLVADAALRGHLTVSDDELRESIAAIPAFQAEGGFSKSNYEALLRAQNMTPQMFEARLRYDMTLSQLTRSIAESAVVPRSVTERLAAMQEQRREVAESLVPAQPYLAQVKLPEEQLKAHYEANAAEFRIPERVRAEYLVLSAEALGQQEPASDAELKAAYDARAAQYKVEEQRRASHILVKTKEEADKLAAELRKAPGRFAELAKKHSQDPGSAEKGGDLGFFGRGMMVKSFEDAAYKLKDGEISGVVESDFGFHIIKLTGIHAAKEKPLAEVRGEIEAELKKAGASRKFAEAAESFSNTVYEQADSLKPVADKFKLTVKQSGWIGRQANPANGPLANEKLMAALFSEDSVKNKRNSEAVEIAPNTLVAARIVEYKAASLQPIDGVKASIETMLRRKEAQALALKDGEARLEVLKKGEDKLAWGAVKSVSRLDASLIPPLAVSAVFKLDTAKLPAYTGVELPGAGFALFKLVKVGSGEKIDDARQQGMQRQLGQLYMQEEVQVYLSALRNRYKVDINKAALESARDR